VKPGSAPNVRVLTGIRSASFLQDPRRRDLSSFRAGLYRFYLERAAEVNQMVSDASDGSDANDTSLEAGKLELI